MKVVKNYIKKNPPFVILMFSHYLSKEDIFMKLDSIKYFDSKKIISRDTIYSGIYFFN